MTTVQFFGMLVAATFIASGGWFVYKIKLPLRSLASGGLLAYGFFQAQWTITGQRSDFQDITMYAAALAINVSLMYFAYIANKIMTSPSREVYAKTTDRIARASTDFHPTDISDNKDMHHG